MKYLIAVTAALLISSGAVAASDEAVQVDSGFPAGTGGRVERRAEDHLAFIPQTTAPGGQFFYVCVRVDHLQAGRPLRLDIVWPPALKADAASGPAPKGDAARNYMASFAAVAPQVTFQSGDLRAWTPVAGVTLADENTIRVPVVGTGRPLYVATQIPYHAGLYDDLIRHVKEREPAALEEAGQSHGGRPLHVITLEATRPEARPRTVYIQAYQHLTEFSGPLVADAAVRYLLDTDAGRKARRDLSFQVLPVFQVDSLAPGRAGAPRSGQTSNPNRDWSAKTWPEVRAVDAFLRRQAAGGRKYVLGFDLHSGWSQPKASGACYTIFPKGQADEAAVARQKQFIDFMYARTDHEAPGRYWAHDAEGTFKQYFYETTGAPSYTVEFSRFMWWNRAAKAYEPYRPEHPARFAGQFIDAIAEFCGPATPK